MQVERFLDLAIDKGQLPGSLQGEGLMQSKPKAIGIRQWSPLGLYGSKLLLYRQACKFEKAGERLDPLIGIRDLKNKPSKVFVHWKLPKY